MKIITFYIYRKGWKNQLSKVRVYLCGAMGCYKDNPELGEAWRLDVEEYFKALSDDIVCVNPALLYKYNADWHYKESEIMRYELRLVGKCDVVLANLKDLDKSVGSCDEILYAYLHDIPVIGFSDEDVYIHPWKEEQIERIEEGANAMHRAAHYIVGYYGF